MCQNNVKLTYIALLCRVTNIEDMMKLNLEDVVKTKKKTIHDEKYKDNNHK